VTRRIQSARQIAAHTRPSHWAWSIVPFGMALLVAACGANTTNTDNSVCQKTPQYVAQRGPIAATTAPCANYRCYGIVRWAGGSVGFTQVAVHISTTALHCVSCTIQFIDNEAWLSDSQLNWVEAGYGTFGSVTYAFWADNRPSTSGNYHEHLLAPASGTIYYSIKAAGSNTFDIVASQNNSNLCTGQSKNNALSATNNIADIGLEVYDGTSASNTPTCGGGSSFTAQTATFSSVSLTGSPPPAPAPISASSPIKAPWSASMLTKSCK
jgi:hypothetical protein